MSYIYTYSAIVFVLSEVSDYGSDIQIRASFSTLTRFRVSLLKRLLWLEKKAIKVEESLMPLFLVFYEAGSSSPYNSHIS